MDLHLVLTLIGVVVGLVVLAVGIRRAGRSQAADVADAAANVGAVQGPGAARELVTASGGDLVSFEVAADGTASACIRLGRHTATGRSNR